MCFLRSYYLQTWHRISWPILNTHLLIFIHVPLKLSLSSIYNLEKKKVSPFALLIATNCSIKFASSFFFFLIEDFFFSRTDFICGYWISWDQFRIKSTKYWYSVQWSFENFVLFYHHPFPAQFFVDVKKVVLLKRKTLFSGGAPG